MRHAVYSVIFVLPPALGGGTVPQGMDVFKVCGGNAVDEAGGTFFRFFAAVVIPGFAVAAVYFAGTGGVAGFFVVRGVIAPVR